MKAIPITSKLPVILTCGPGLFKSSNHFAFEAFWTGLSVYLYMCGPESAMELCYGVKSEDSLWGVGSLLPLGPRNQTLFVRLSGGHLCQLGHFSGLLHIFLTCKLISSGAF